MTFSRPFIGKTEFSHKRGRSHNFSGEPNSKMHTMWEPEKNWRPTITNTRPPPEKKDIRCLRILITWIIVNRALSNYYHRTSLGSLIIYDMLVPPKCHATKDVTTALSRAKFINHHSLLLDMWSILKVLQIKKKCWTSPKSSSRTGHNLYWGEEAQSKSMGGQKNCPPPDLSQKNFGSPTPHNQTPPPPR